jgi:hypothetical protein
MSDYLTTSVKSFPRTGNQIIPRGDALTSQGTSGTYDNPDEVLQKRFGELADQWEKETRNMSSTVHKSMHPAYQDILAMGPQAIPLILDRLRDKGGHWFWALAHLAKTDPVPASARGNVKKMRDAWLKWGRDRRL